VCVFQVSPFLHNLQFRQYRFDLLEKWSDHPSKSRNFGRLWRTLSYTNCQRIRLESNANFSKKWVRYSIKCATKWD
jgi:hypothetical protein